MQKGNQIYVYPSPSVTPQCVHLKSKSASGHRKPPVHSKKAQGDMKILKACKKAKSRTSSFTPKPVKLNIFDRGFHNNNLSDTDVSTKYIDLTYTNNKLKASIFSKNELSKIKDCKTPNKNINKIIRKSLIKAKNLKISQDRINKESRIEKEIKKNEINLQNKQIRMQNLIKYKKRKKSKKKSNEGLAERQLEILPRMKKNNLGDSIKKKRNTNSVDLYHPERDHELLELVEKRKGQRSRNESMNYIERIAAGISKSNKLENCKNLEKETDYLRRKDFDKVERNISFIEEGSDLDIFSARSEVKKEIQNSQKNPENSARLIQRYFRKYLAKKYLKNKLSRHLNLSREDQIFIKGYHRNLQLESKKIFDCAPRKKTNSITKEASLSFHKSIKKTKFVLSKSADISIPPQKKIELLTQKETAVFVLAKTKESLLSSNQILSEQVAMNLAQVNIIEQLRLEELSLIENLTRAHADQGTYLTAVHNKYKLLISHLKSTLKRLQNPFLDIISVQSFSNIKKLQQKFEDEIKDHIKSDLTLNFSIPISSALDLENQISSDLSSDEIDSLVGISHSPSTIQLLSDPSQVKFKDSHQLTELNMINLNLSNDFESDKDLPSLPNFSLAQMDNLQVDVPNSEIRILTSTDSILDFAQDILNKLDFSYIIHEISKPINRSPLIELEKINNKPIGTCIESGVYDYPNILNPDIILKEESDSEIDSTIRELGKADFVHKKMIILVIDYLLQINRPFGLSGSPMPWQRSKLKPNKILTPEFLKTKIMKEVEIFSLFQIGRIFNEEIMNVSSGIDNEIIDCLREEKLEKAVLCEAVLEEEQWTCYDFEETQTKLDLADLIIEILADEVITVCNQ